MVNMQPCLNYKQKVILNIDLNMTSVDDLERRIFKIEERNRIVQADKAWETS